MRLVHYSQKPIREVLTKQQGVEPDMKPRGLWVSVPGGDPCWREWCESESFGDIDKCIEHEVHLSPDANILWLRSPSNILEFHREYERELYAGSSYNVIDWKSVASRYDGIIITPYQWSLRLDGRCRWYYGWDCASGCIWNGEAATISQVEPADA